MTVRAWYGTEWQDFCILLLRKRYDSHDLQEVPDRHNGDLGIEAFSHDGCAFQCYAALEPVNVNDLYESQRDKLTEDLGKLKKNASALEAMLGDIRIKKYVYMVHRNDSRKILTHAATKAAEVRSWGLSFILDEFKIVVVTDDYYAAERSAIVAIPAQLVSPDPVASLGMAKWINENAPLVKEANRKLTGVGTTGAALDRYIDALLTQFLEGENALQKLRVKYPEQWRTTTTIKSRKEGRLALDYPATQAAPSEVILNVAHDLAAEIIRDAPSISGPLAESMAWAVVADWIMRCPLELQVEP
jgi:hypothetical protein